MRASTEVLLIDSKDGSRVEIWALVLKWYLCVYKDSI